MAAVTYQSTTGGMRKHVVIVEAVLRHKLPKGAVVHHADEDKRNNKNSNLVALQSRAEHNSLHRRLRVLKAGGDPWTQMLCKDCKLPKAFDQFCPSEIRLAGGRCKPCNALRSSFHYHSRRRT